jgi:hypothetical protein
LALFNESDLRAILRNRPMYKSVTDSIVERSATPRQKDVFLSHSFADKDLVLGAAMLLERFGYTVYIDWREDGHLDRSAVTQETAALLRERMRSCKSLVYANTQGSTTSKWMPWELGFKDGNNGRATLLPIAQVSALSFSGQEYLTIYPYLVPRPYGGQNKLFVQWDDRTYVEFDQWLAGIDPFKRY